MAPTLSQKTHERSLAKISHAHAHARARGLRARLLPAAGRAFSRIAPRTAGVWAANRFLTPARPAADEFALDTIAAAQPFRAPLGEIDIAAWSWGDGPAILLVHGWGGRAGQMTRLVRPLTEAGFRVLAFDAPGHGASSGHQSNALQISRAIGAVAGVQGGVHGVIAHSLGAIGAGLAVERGLKIERLAFVGAPAQAEPILPFFAGALGFTPRAAREMRQQIEQRVGIEFGRLDLPAMGRILGASVPGLLVIHDRDDKEVSWNNGPAIAKAWHGARLVSTEGLGHKRILRDPAVADRLRDFMREEAAEASRESPVAAE